MFFFIEDFPHWIKFVWKHPKCMGGWCGWNLSLQLNNFNFVVYWIHLKLANIETCLIIVASWGLKKNSKEAFRPAMELSTGELSGLGGSILMMTATATMRTLRVLKEQFPEIRKWTTVLHSPMRENVTMVVPPPDVLSPKVEILLDPFIKEIKENRKRFLILVRGMVGLFKNTYMFNWIQLFLQWVQYPKIQV